MTTMTYNKYDQLLETFNEMKAPLYWPTIQQIDEWENDPDKWLEFCCYLYEKSPAPTTGAERYSKRNMLDFINRHLQLVDEEEEREEE
jgi:hypothetical protein